MSWCAFVALFTIPAYKSTLCSNCLCPTNRTRPWSPRPILPLMALLSALICLINAERRTSHFASCGAPKRAAWLNVNFQSPPSKRNNENLQKFVLDFLRLFFWEEMIVIWDWRWFMLWLRTTKKNCVILFRSNAFHECVRAESCTKSPDLSLLSTLLGPNEAL